MHPIKHAPKVGGDALAIQCINHPLPQGLVPGSFLEIQQVNEEHVTVQTYQGKRYTLLECQLDAGRSYKIDGQVEPEWLPLVINLLSEIVVKKAREGASDVEEWKDYLARAEHWQGLMADKQANQSGARGV